MKEKISREKFIRLGSAIGVSAAGAAVISACGSSGGSGSGSSGGASSSAASGSSSTSNSATQEASGGGQAIAQASEVAPGSATKFTDSGNPAVLVHLDGGEFAAYSAVCTHQGCTVAYQDGQLACPCHGSVFDPSNGAQVVNGPAQRPLPEIPVEVRGGEVFRA